MSLTYVCDQSRQYHGTAAPTFVTVWSIFVGGRAVLTARTSEARVADTGPIPTDPFRTLKQITPVSQDLFPNTLTLKSNVVRCSDLSMSRAGILMSSWTGTAVWTVEALTTCWSLKSHVFLFDLSPALSTMADVKALVCVYRQCDVTQRRTA